MKSINYLAGTLLVLAGIIHGQQIIAGPKEQLAANIIFAIVYLCIGILLNLNNKYSYYFGAIVPLFGILLATIGIIGKIISVTDLLLFLLAIDIIVVSSCFYLIKSSKNKITMRST